MNRLSLRASVDPRPFRHAFERSGIRADGDGGIGGTGGVLVRLRLSIIGQRFRLQLPQFFGQG
jgi:hypothetical protein